MPALAWHPPNNVVGIAENPVYNGTATNLTRAREYRRAYYAAVAYTDYNIGLVLSALDSIGKTNSTLVSVIGKCAASCA